MLSVHGETAHDAPVQGPRWINLVDPSPEEMRRLLELEPLDEAFIGHALDQHECPRIEVDHESTMVVVRAPYLETRHGDRRHSTVPIGVILTPTGLTTICKVHDQAIQERLRSGLPPGGQMRAERRLCHIVKEVSLLFMLYLKEISAEIQELEHDLADTRTNEDLKQLLTLQKSVTYFHSALKTNDFIIDRILRKGLAVGNAGRLNFTEDEEDVLDYALTETRQGIYMSKIFTEVLSSIANVTSSIISNSVNQIMKVLTSMTVIIMIPTFVTSLYGMNVELPFQHDALAFLIVAAMGGALTAGVIWVMKLRRIL
ncbi:Cobalt/magnesium transport protein CorA [Fundidesulfovibrio magnetotacticus]|uniref:Cobalt/magnesium transport protein CorA n=1 Tax=Fundidesulfovibrio magnetotacticus TaxID=2730080 RepID=A0A6V8LS53_9BACT|nr:magnesium transporter CorA family protein [Fundidesulfovibrio magnetotacticus]GFK93148.1 Cobalt/magnesium transport protein CorA [Fundidesulfovibrio magnetotacticus]